MCVRTELKKFLGKTIMVDLVGRNFSPKGELKEVADDFIIVGNDRILIANIAAFKLSTGGYR